MQIGKALINDRLRVSKLSWKVWIPLIYTFAVSYSWNLLFSLKLCYFLAVSIISSVPKLDNLKTRTAMYAKTSVFVIRCETIIYLLLHNLHDCTFKDLNKWSLVSNISEAFNRAIPLRNVMKNSEKHYLQSSVIVMFQVALSKFVIDVVCCNKCRTL